MAERKLTAQEQSLITGAIAVVMAHLRERYRAHYPTIGELDLSRACTEVFAEIVFRSLISTDVLDHSDAHSTATAVFQRAGDITRSRELDQLTNDDTRNWMPIHPTIQ